MLVGLGWDGADERKMQITFQMGKADFTTFYDLSRIGKSLGYNRAGLSSLSQCVLGLSLQKSKAVSAAPHAKRR